MEMKQRQIERLGAIEKLRAMMSDNSRLQYSPY
jgi:hypothetical protein